MGKLDQALLFCKQTGSPLTEPRSDVLKALIEEQKPLGAYAILTLLNKDRERKYMPQTIYRAINFWEKTGFVHRVDSINAYYVCQGEQPHRDTHFLICDRCSSVQEVPFQESNFESSQFFKSSYRHLESHGVCSVCSN